MFEVKAPTGTNKDNEATPRRVVEVSLIEGLNMYFDF
jgi:hypothetical protein